LFRQCASADGVCGGATFRIGGTMKREAGPDHEVGVGEGLNLRFAERQKPELLRRC
jgi:hypothetical protein